MNKKTQNNERIFRRKARVRARISGSSSKPRVSVFRSNRYTYVQLIDDANGRTLAALSTRDLGKSAKKTPVELSKILGEKLGKKAGEIGISKAVMDRGSYRYHGRIKALVEGARDGGLKI